MTKSKPSSKYLHLSPSLHPNTSLLLQNHSTQHITRTSSKYPKWWRMALTTTLQTTRPASSSFFWRVSNKLKNIWTTSTSSTPKCTHWEKEMKIRETSSKLSTSKRSLISIYITEGKQLPSSSIGWERAAILDIGRMSRSSNWFRCGRSPTSGIESREDMRGRSRSQGVHLMLWRKKRQYSGSKGLRMPYKNKKNSRNYSSRMS